MDQAKISDWLLHDPNGQVIAFFLVAIPLMFGLHAVLRWWYRRTFRRK